MKYQYKSYAKLNLFIKVLEKRVDGYHNIQSIFQKIDLFDDLTFEKRNDDRIIIKSNIKSLEKDNIIFKTIDALKKKLTIQSWGLDINLKKNIPIGSGLGGGSSNAAVTLLALKKIFNINRNNRFFKEISSEIGSDVPFFLLDCNAWAEGRGEILTPIYTKPKWFVLVTDGTRVSTQEIYDSIRVNKNAERYNYDDYLDGSLRNDFLSTVIDKYPSLNVMYRSLSKIGKLSLSGTGSTFFFSVNKRQDAENLAKKVPSNYNPKIVKSI